MMLLCRPRSRFTQLVGLSLALTAIPAGAQTAADPPPVSPEVVITGQLEETEERARDFADLAAGRSQSGQLPRWDGSVCLAFGGLTADQKRFFGDAIRQVGATVGIPAGLGNRCDRMAIVVFTDQSDRLLKRIQSSGSPVLYGWNRHRRRLMAASPAPVRWLARAALVGARGQAANRDGDAFSEQAGRAPPSFQKPYASRLLAATRADQQAMFVLVDSTRLNGATNLGLANYLAMVVLAGPDKRQAPPSPSILQLFDGGAERPETLTDWDRAYLAALYNSAPDTTAFLQEREVARRMARSLTRGDPEP